MSVSVLVPFASGCPHRERAWGYVRAHYEREHADWELIEGTCTGLWSKGLALVDAKSRSTGETFVVADADSFVAPEVLTEAVELVRAGATWVVPHYRVQRLSQYYTRAVIEANAPVRRGRVHRQPYIGVLGGGIVVLSRDVWEAVGGIDPRYLGWGGEDISFGYTLETLVGPPARLEADLWHLWHPPATKNRRGSPESEALAARYKAARGTRHAMLALIEEVDREPPSAASTAVDHQAS